MKGMGMPFTFKGRCLSCNKIMLVEPADHIPWCDECRERRTKEFQKKRPDIAEKGKVVLASQVIEPEKQDDKQT